MSSRLVFLIVKENQSFFTEFSLYILTAVGLTKYLNASRMKNFSRACGSKKIPKKISAAPGSQMVTGKDAAAAAASA